MIKVAKFKFIFYLILITAGTFFASWAGAALASVAASLKGLYIVFKVILVPIATVLTFIGKLFKIVIIIDLILIAIMLLKKFGKKAFGALKNKMSRKMMKKVNENQETNPSNNINSSSIFNK